MTNFGISSPTLIWSNFSFAGIALLLGFDGLAGFDQGRARDRNLLTLLVGVLGLHDEHGHLATAAALFLDQVRDLGNAGQHVADQDVPQQLELLFAVRAAAQIEATEAGAGIS